MPEKYKERLTIHETGIAESGVVELDNLPEELGGTVPLKDITGKLNLTFYYCYYYYYYDYN